MGSFDSRHLRRVVASLLVAVSAAALVACQNKTASIEAADSMTTASTGPASFKETAELGKKWNAEPGNIAIGVAYANGLESVGQTDQQMMVLKSLAQAHPSELKVQSLFGKKLLQNGRAGEAVPVLERAALLPSADWRVLSALGSAYDQQSSYAKAREQYQKALAASPDELPVLNNLAMSHALEGDLKGAENTLRQASLLPKSRSEPRIRQNLALVVGLQGRFDEARKIASEDLPPNQVEANMAYLKKMLSQPNTWQQLSGETQG